MSDRCSICGAQDALYQDNRGNALCEKHYQDFLQSQRDAYRARRLLHTAGTFNKWGNSCFIVTAAYGTPMAEEIGVLRRFRDNELQLNRFGRCLITLYYETSPPLARVVAQSERMKAFVRLSLKPIVRYFESRNNQ